MKKFLKMALLAGWVCQAWAEAPPPQRWTLPNGIPLIVQESYSSPTVSLNIYIRVGSVFEAPTLNGISHFYEHMFFRGTPTRSGLKFKREIEALGGITNATTGRDFTHYYINLPKQYLRQGLELLADAYLHAECAQESVDAERLVVLEEFRLGFGQPGRMMADRIYAKVYGEHPYGKTIIGPEENLKSIGRQELLAFKRDYYVPARTKLVITGDLDPQEVRQTCKELFGSFQAHGSGDPKMAAPPTPKEPQVFDEVSKTGRPLVCLAYLGPSVKERQDVIRIDLLSFLIGNSKNSLLGRELGATKTGLEGQCEYLTSAFPGLIMVFADALQGKEQESLDKAQAVLKKVREGNFDEKDIARARKTLTTLYRFGNETNAGKAGNWGTYETIDRMDFASAYLDSIEKVTKKDLVEAANKYFTPGHYQFFFRAGGRP